jgi:hypothetical protein
MSLTERHRWCLGKILEAFSPELSAEQVQSFMRQESTIQKFSSFFRGEGAGRLFIFYQSDAGEGEVSSIFSLFRLKFS